MGLKQKVYNTLANRKPQIKAKFEAYLEGEEGQASNVVKKFSQLIKLNLSYYVLEDKSTAPDCVRENIEANESCVPGVSPDALAEKLMGYEVISFDVFDTMIYRYVARPTDVFYFIGNSLGCVDFRRLRIEAEKTVRKEKLKLSGSAEVNLDEIAEELEKSTGISKTLLINAELEAEKALCYPNPYMKRVWDILRAEGKALIILSDMYLGENNIRELLEICGYDTSDTEIMVSCDLLKSKADGSLYTLLKKLKCKCRSFAHIGDNENSDIINAKKAKITAFKCINPDKKGSKYRTNKMSPIQQSVWAGLVNKKMYSELNSYDRYFNSGYNYCGILIYGFCSFIERLTEKSKLKKILFCGSGKDILKNIYDKYFNHPDTETINEPSAEASDRSVLKVSIFDEEASDAICFYNSRESTENTDCYIEDGISDKHSAFIKYILTDSKASAEGIYAFAEDYDSVCRRYAFLKEISGADAYAPLCSASDTDSL